MATQDYYYLSQFRNPESRLRALSEIPLDQPALIDILLQALEDPYPGVRFRAGDRLANLEGVEEKVRALFGNATSKTKQAALLAFRKEHVEQESEDLVLEYALSPREPSLRYHALLALHLFAKESLLKSISEAIFDDGDDDALIIAAQWSAIYLWKDHMGAIKKAFTDSTNKDLGFQLAISLSKLVSDLSQMPEGSQAQIIDAVLDDKISMTACQAIARLKISDAIKTLRRVPNKIFMHELLKVEAAATRAMLGEKEGKKALGKYIEDKREHVSSYACECTGRYKIDLAKSLRKALKKKDDRRIAAQNALDALEKI